MASTTTGFSSNEGVAAKLESAGACVRGLRGWRRALFAFAAGLVSALGFEPVNAFPLLLLGFGALVLLLDGAQDAKRPMRAGALVGWAFGFGIFLAGLYWVGYAFTVDAAEHAWQIPFVECLLPGGLALFPAAACAVASLIWREGPSRILTFSVCYAVSEWLRGHILTGFPWNLPAYTWGAALPVLQCAAVIGAYGLSLLTILFGASLADLTRPRSWQPAAIIACLFVVLFAAGEIRLAVAPTRFVPNVQLRLVQPDVRQQDKYVLAYRARNWRELIDLTTRPAAVTPTHIVWPEAAPPFLLTRIPEALDEIAVLTPHDHVLMTGAVRVLASPDTGYRYFNSVYIFSHGGQLLDAYDKFHLVPFGEYLPLSGLMTKLGISKLVDSPGGFTPGDGPHTYAVPGAPPAGPLICYEILFPGAVTGLARPGWFVNVTDDSWFGTSSGPYQHLLTARVRAIEEGVPVARAANTGVSAVIDPAGRIIASLELNKAGVVDAGLPAAFAITPYARWGDAAFALLLVVCGIFALLFLKRNAHRQDLST